jgi:hypothetical protein
MTASTTLFDFRSDFEMTLKTKSSRAALGIVYSSRCWRAAPFQTSQTSVGTMGMVSGIIGISSRENSLLSLLELLKKVQKYPRFQKYKRIPTRLHPKLKTNVEKLASPMIISVAIMGGVKNKTQPTVPRGMRYGLGTKGASDNKERHQRTPTNQIQTARETPLSHTFWFGNP